MRVAQEFFSEIKSRAKARQEDTVVLYLNYITTAHRADRAVSNLHGVEVAVCALLSNSIFALG